MMARDKAWGGCFVKIRAMSLIASCCLTAMVVIAADPGLEGTWSTDGVAGFVAAKEAGKSLNGLPEAVIIKFKVDKKNKITGAIDQMNSGKNFDVVDGKLIEKSFTFNSLESGNGQAKPVPWRGELTGADTITLTRVQPEGQPA